jgi:hypothetical protein
MFSDDLRLEQAPPYATLLMVRRMGSTSLATEDDELTLFFPNSFELSDVQHSAFEDLAARIPHENDRELFDLVVAQGIISVLRAAGAFTQPPVRA